MVKTENWPMVHKINYLYVYTLRYYYYRLPESLVLDQYYIPTSVWVGLVPYI